MAEKKVHGTCKRHSSQCAAQPLTKWDRANVEAMPAALDLESALQLTLTENGVWKAPHTEPSAWRSFPGYPCNIQSRHNAHKAKLRKTNAIKETKHKHWCRKELWLTLFTTVELKRTSILLRHKWKTKMRHAGHRRGGLDYSLMFASVQSSYRWQYNL